MEFLGVKAVIGIGIGQEDLGRERIKQWKQVRFFQVLRGLRGHDENAIVLAPGLCGFDEVVANRLHSKKLPCLIENKDLQNWANGRVIDNGAGAVKDIKQQCL